MRRNSAVSVCSRCTHATRFRRWPRTRRCTRRRRHRMRSSGRRPSTWPSWSGSRSGRIRGFRCGASASRPHRSGPCWRTVGAPACSCWRPAPSWRPGSASARPRWRACGIRRARWWCYPKGGGEDDRDGGAGRDRRDALRGGRVRRRPRVQAQEAGGSGLPRLPHGRAPGEAVCQREVELNRRLAPDVYLGVADVTGPTATVCDPLVVMRRMPASRRLSTLVQAGADVRAGCARSPDQLAAFHATARHDPQTAAEGTRDAVRGALAGELRADPAVPRAASWTRRTTAEVERLALRYLAGREPLFVARIGRRPGPRRARRPAGRRRVLLPDGPRVLDCLEFDDRLRYVDGLDDAAFLAMDLERLGAPSLGAVVPGLVRGVLRHDRGWPPWNITTWRTGPSCGPRWPACGPPRAIRERSGGPRLRPDRTASPACRADSPRAGRRPARGG